MQVKIVCDGACSGNPGPAGYSFGIISHDGNQAKIHSARIGQSTNNRAELLAIYAALRYCEQFDKPAIKILTDSQNAIGWITGKYKAKVPEIVDMVGATRVLLASGKFQGVDFEWLVKGQSSDEVVQQVHDAVDKAAKRKARGG